MRITRRYWYGLLFAAATIPIGGAALHSPSASSAGQAPLGRSASRPQQRAHPARQGSLHLPPADLTPQPAAPTVPATAPSSHVP